MRLSISNFLSTYYLSIIAAIAFALSLFFLTYYYDKDFILIYTDARTRLNMARRIFDSLTPGFTQLGGIWPPFPQLLFLLTTWNDFMYRSGLSGSLISMTSFILTSIFLTKLIVEVTNDKLAAFIGILVIFLNSSFLYMQSVPMTEPLLICLLTLTTFSILKWYTQNKIIYLIAASFLVFVASLTRYDGWFLAVIVALVVIFIGYLKKGIEGMDGYFFIYSAPAFFGIFLWLAYETIIFGDPLVFSTGEGTAAFHLSVESAGIAQTKNNFLFSVSTYLWAIFDNIGILSIIGFLCLIYTLLIIRKIKNIIPVLVLFTPIFFNILSLYLGQSVLFTEHMPPYTLTDIRYGLLSLPLVAYLVGMVSSRSKILKIFFLFALLIQAVVFFNKVPVTLLDPIRVEQHVSGLERNKLIKWIKNNPTEGLVLTSTLANDSLVFSANIRNSKLIYEGSGKYWKESIRNPSKYASRIIVRLDYPRDILWNESLKNPHLFDNLQLVYKSDYYLVYEK